MKKIDKMTKAPHYMDDSLSFLHVGEKIPPTHFSCPPYNLISNLIRPFELLKLEYIFRRDFFKKNCIFIQFSITRPSIFLN